MSLIGVSLILTVFSVSAKPYGLNSLPRTGAFLDGRLPEVAPSISGNWSAIVAFPNLLFTNAVGLAPVPDSNGGTNLLCVWEREGRIWTFENSSNTTEKKLVLDIHNQCQGWDDSGLLGVAFHPGFATNHFIFVYYTWVAPGTVVGDPNTRPNPVIPNKYHDRLERYTLDSNGIAIPDSVKIFVDLTNQTVWHHGGGMFFHPANGLLYWTDGDNSVGDNDQIITKSLYSGVFRIDVDCRGGNFSHAPPRQPTNGFTANYFIPNDNPFVGQSNALEEFFCLGLRSPHRMTIDPPTGKIFIGDVGESSREEIDEIEPGESGLNFQWNYCEGNLGKMPTNYIGISRGPVLDYPHTDGRAVIGGYIYRGKKFEHDLGGKYIFGDNVMRVVWAMDETTTPAQKTVLCVMPKGDGPNSGSDYTGLSSFGIDAEGEIYFCQMSSIGGQIFKLQRGGPPPPKKVMPKLLSQTGVFTDIQNLTPADFLLPYNVNSPLWSDGAVKQRWMVLPRNSKINFSANSEWKFPDGAVFVKNFDLPVDDTNPKILRRLETRLIICDTNGGVYGATYKWRADNSDADLVTTGTTEIITIKTATGTRAQKWFFPGRQDCLTCHTPVSGGVLGVKTRQLNGNFTYPNGVTDNQLRTLGHLGIFDGGFSALQISRYPKLVNITNTSAALELRARSYLDANCAMCHRPGGVGAFFDARFITPLKKQNLLNGPVANLLGIPGAKVIVPGETNKSILFHRISILGEGQMPPIARNVVDDQAVAVIGHWISNLPAKTITLPRGWSDTDIGNVGASGEASFLNGNFNLLASGDDIWENADAFHFAFKTLKGDGQIVAHISSLQYTDPWAKAGVMFRETNSADSKYVMMAVTAHNSSVYQWRPTSGQSSRNTDGASAIIANWVRLTRKGDAFTGEISVDGKKWTRVDNISVPMNKTIYVGLALSAHNNSELNSTLFDNVSVSP
ncbi:MAG TPA: PQQ-dependent sugar dehydrogenase [Verrucomicrobiae bacterium]|nr:PQQ-dependent sugar dehydrogenase [Verrucomicrobiae bacterium]